MEKPSVRIFLHYNMLSGKEEEKTRQV